MLSLIQEIVDKIRTSDVGSQMLYLSKLSKQFQPGNEAVLQTKEKPKPSKPTVVGVKRTSSGRIVRQRMNPDQYNDDEDGEDDNDEGKQKDTPQQQKQGSASTLKPSSLNPFCIPVTLLNFKQALTTLVAKHQAK